MSSEQDQLFLAAAGALSSGVTDELRAPLREIRDALAVLVETLDHHFAVASGPEPYPWAATKALRERLAETYLLSRAVTRITADLARAVSIQRGAGERTELNQLVEQAVALARHRFGDDCEVSIDAGALPAVELIPGELVLLLSTLLGEAADSARAGGGAVFVRTRREEEGGLDQALIQVSEGSGDRDRSNLEALARRVLTPVGGTLGRAAGKGGGAALLEIRIPLGKPVGAGAEAADARPAADASQAPEEP
jgi:signal transduction histidine kinase